MAQFLAGLLLGFSTCATAATAGPDFPAPRFPDANPPTPAKVALGAQLFLETALSQDGSFSCASCHNPNRHFVDGHKVAVGVTGEKHTRNTPTLYNVAFNASLGWDNKGLERLEEQHLVPLLGTDPLEMGFSPTAARELVRQPHYQAAFRTAFGENQMAELPELTLIVYALASYVRSLRHPENPFDRYMFGGDPGAISAGAKAGLALFTSPRLGCSDCHNGFSLAGPLTYSGHQGVPVFHNTGVDNTTESFRAPTLRAIRYTAPYMHAGNLATLEEVVHHYQTTQASAIPRFTLTATEQAQLIAFLKTL